MEWVRPLKSLIKLEVDHRACSGQRIGGHANSATPAVLHFPLAGRSFAGSGKPLHPTAGRGYVARRMRLNAFLGSRTIARRTECADEIQQLH
ncbi:hypothetical protein MCEMSEM23_00967 [Rhabdaerophilaceae bacterium]